MLLTIVTAIKNLAAYYAGLAELSHMSERELADIGLSRTDVKRVMSGRAAR
jgi:uncharacterized protein YjiS (DUF1127 family)